MSKFNCTERDKIVKRYIRRKIHPIHCRNFQAMFTIFHYASRVSFFPSSDFEKLSREMSKTRNPGWIKKFFRRDINQLGILDVGWQRSHGPLNIFSVCLSRAKISRSSRRDLLQKKRKKNSSSSLFFPAPFFYFSPFAASTAEENFDGDSCLQFSLRSSYPDISHNEEEAFELLVATRETLEQIDQNRARKNDKSLRWTSCNLPDLGTRGEGEKRIGKRSGHFLFFFFLSPSRDANNK